MSSFNCLCIQYQVCCYGSTAFTVASNPVGAAQIITSGNTAIAFFTTPGSVKLNVNSSTPSSTASSDVTVVDEVYSPLGATADFSAGEAFTFTPISDGKGGFYFAVKTKKEYEGLNNTFEYDAEYIGAEKKFSINLKALSVPSALVSGNGSANGFMFFKGPIAKWTYDLQLCAGFNCYFGSLEVTDTEIKFNWTDTDIIIQPKTIAK